MTKYDYGYGTDTQTFVKTVPSVFGDYHIFDTGEKYVVYGPDKYCTFIAYDDLAPEPPAGTHWGVHYASVTDWSGLCGGFGSLPRDAAVNNTNTSFIGLNDSILVIDENGNKVRQFKIQAGSCGGY